MRSPMNENENKTASTQVDLRDKIRDIKFKKTVQK